MARLHRYTSLALLGIGLAGNASPGTAADRIVLEADLTKGRPADERFTIKGGEWKDGWNVIGETDQLVIDARRDIANGYVEVVVTRQGELNFKERKRNWMGVFALPKGHQNSGGYARAGDAQYAFSKAEIFAADQEKTICEKKFGTPQDWVLDGKTERTVRAEVANNVMTWSNDTGGTTFCGSDTQPVTHFRYLMLGGVLDEKTGWHHGSLVGLRVLRLKIVERNRP